MLISYGEIGEISQKCLFLAETQQLLDGSALQRPRKFYSFWNTVDVHYIRFYSIFYILESVFVVYDTTMKVTPATAGRALIASERAPLHFSPHPLPSPRPLSSPSLPSPWRRVNTHTRPSRARRHRATATSPTHRACPPLHHSKACRSRATRHSAAPRCPEGRKGHARTFGGRRMKEPEPVRLGEGTWSSARVLTVEHMRVLFLG